MDSTLGYMLFGVQPFIQIQTTGRIARICPYLQDTGHPKANPDPYYLHSYIGSLWVPSSPCITEPFNKN